MFTGIIEAVGTVQSLNREGANLRITLKSSFFDELKVDQSVAHDGVCLTVVRVENGEYDVVAVDETLRRTALGSWKAGSRINLERCMRLGDRLDGHIVQGHVDTTAEVVSVQDADGSWNFAFRFVGAPGHPTVEKGSICVNGVSLTVVDSTDNGFSVTIIPYTYEHTNFSSLKVGSIVNIEFDIIGKYVARMLAQK
ncbi:MAG: riboflavin synthase [Bacteroidota bacterium]